MQSSQMFYASKWTDIHPSKLYDGETQPKVGDIIIAKTAAHPVMGEPYEVIGRVGCGANGLYADNRYLSHCWDIRVIESAPEGGEDGNRG